ncbi:hypothetical protein BH23PLA1_BH23PLA1_22770 [soil metagenome]
MEARWALAWLLVVSALLRLWLAWALGAGNDEAYYALFVRHPAWSYFDQPPLLAVVGGLSRWISGGSESILALRLGFVALFSGSTWLMARLASRCLGPSAAFPAALALNLSWYHGAAVGTFVLPDGPLLFFWLLTLERLASAVQRPERWAVWIGVGLAWGGALLSKYHAVFLPLGFLIFVAVEPTARRLLRQPGPYLALIVGLVGFSPVIAWNAEQGWASFAFQGGRALGALGVRPDELAEAIVGPLLYLSPWLWLALVVVLIRATVRFWNQGAEVPPLERLLLCQSWPPLVLFWALSALRPGLPHWGLIGFVSVMPVLGRAWADQLVRRPRATRRRLAVWSALAVSLAVLAVGQSKFGVIPKEGRGALGWLDPAQDPTRDLFGWDQIALELDRRGLLDRPDTFVFSGHWYVSGQLALAVGDRAPVLCYNEGDARGFAYWSRPEDWIGRDGILIAIDDRSAEPDCFERWFDRIEPLGQFEIVRAGATIRPVRLFRCVGQRRAFPFALIETRKDALRLADRRPESP